MPADLIKLKDVRIPCHIGVPDEERARAQSLSLNLDLSPINSLAGLDDEISGSIDYAEVTECLFEVCAARPRKLLETLGDDLAETLFRRFPIESLRIEIEKQILPGMRAVAIERHFSKGDF